MDPYEKEHITPESGFKENFLGIPSLPSFSPLDPRVNPVWRQYCSRRYNYQTMLDRKREQEQQEDTITVDNVVRMLEQAVTIKVQFVKELSIRKAGQWALELMQDKTFIGPFRNKISDAIEALKNLTFDQRQYAMELFDQFLKPSPTENVLPC